MEVDRLSIRSPDAEERSNDAVVAYGVDSAKRGQPAAGHESHQDRLSLIILLMRGGDVRRAGGHANLLQTGDAHLARGRLHAELPYQLRIERAVGDMQRDVELGAEVAHKLLIQVRLLSAEVMIDVPGDQREVGSLGRRQEKRRGVASAGNRQQKRPADLVLAEEAPYRVQDHGERLPVPQYHG